MAEEQKEVKEFIETKEIAPSEDTELVEDEEKETPADSSTETKPEEEDESDKPDELRGRTLVTKKEPKPVEGETPVERARRSEIERLRGLLREKRTQELLPSDSGKSPEAIASELTEEQQKTLSKYNPDELKNLQEVLGVLAPQLGFVKKEDIAKIQGAITNQSYNDTLDSFLSEHSEYTPENDADNILWNQFKREFSLYRPPATPKELTKLLNRVHSTIFSSSDVDLKKISAQQQKLSQASHAGSTTVRSTRQSVQGSNIDPSLRSKMKGFTDKELDDLLS